MLEAVGEETSEQTDGSSTDGHVHHLIATTLGGAGVLDDVHCEGLEETVHGEETARRQHPQHQHCVEQCHAVLGVHAPSLAPG